MSSQTNIRPVKFLSHVRLLAAALCGVLSLDGIAAEGLYRADPTKILGAENCAECHAPMVEAWKLTHHYDTFNSMHRRPEAKEIAQKLGMRRIKDESLCVKCHYTSQQKDDKVVAISGISCESCHSAGTDWNKVHNNKDDPDRLTKAEKLGMLRPSNYYHVAANCFSCHTVPEEKLVNVAGHKAGSDFELVSWLSGEVRHNLQKSAGKTNDEDSAARKRMLYIVGRSLDLEYGLRGLANATVDGIYSKAMIDRVNAAKTNLETILKAAPAVVEVKAMIDLVTAAELKPNNSAALTKMAGTVGENAAKLAAGRDGSDLAAVDALVPTPDKYKGTPYHP
jgi:hypothetical protein